jgi:hypothetical protein
MVQQRERPQLCPETTLSEQVGLGLFFTVFNDLYLTAGFAGRKYRKRIEAHSFSWSSSWQFTCRKLAIFSSASVLDV